MNYYERHIGDYLKDTAHLSLLEHGVYGRLLDVYYTREGPIHADQAARLIGARSKEEREALAYVVNEFFNTDGDVLTHARCDREIERYQDKQRKASASATARWSKREQHSERNAKAMRTHSERIPDAMLQKCEGNAPSNQTPDTKKRETTRGARLPPDWALPDEWRAFAKAERPDLDADATAVKFRDYWHAKAGAGGRKVDWFATWRNWCREERGAKPDRTVVTLPSREAEKTAAMLAAEEARWKAIQAERKARSA